MRTRRRGFTFSSTGRRCWSDATGSPGWSVDEAVGVGFYNDLPNGEGLSPGVLLCLETVEDRSLKLGTYRVNVKPA